MNTRNPSTRPTPLRLGDTHALLGALTAIALQTLACSNEITTNASVAPELMAISTETVSIGEPMQFYGRAFQSGVRGWTTLRFEGEFKAQNGASNPVDFAIRPHRIGNGVLLWANVGPFTNPFACQNHNSTDDNWPCHELTEDALLGTFSGTVTAANHFTEGGRVNGEPIPMELTFGPSIVIRKLRPLETDCPQPVKRLIGGFPYELEVEAIGFEASNFTMHTKNEPGVDARARLHRVAAIDGRLGTLGVETPLIFRQVEDGQLYYGADFSIKAQGTKNETVGVSYTFGVHRPIEYIDYGTPLVAEIEAPQPASENSGCLSGGVNGLHVQYEEMSSETRSRGFQERYDETWTKDRRTEYSTSHARTRGINSRFERSANNSWAFTWDEQRQASWSLTAEAELGGTVGIPHFGNLSAGGKLGGARTWGWQKNVGGSLGGSNSISKSVGNDFSESDTEQWTQSDGEGYNQTIGTTATDDVSTTDAITEAINGDIIAGQQGVWYRQAIRLARPGAIFAYNMCGEHHVVAQTEHSDYLWNFALAQGPTCSPLPKPLLPEKQCLHGCK